MIESFRPGSAAVDGPPRTRAAAPDVRNAIQAAARSQNLGEALVEAVAWQESKFRSDAVSPRGAIGLMQLMPETARALRVDPADLYANALGGASYLRSMLDRYDGDIVKALAAYNAGPGKVDHYRGIPPYPETKAYVANILERLAANTTRPAIRSTGIDP